MPYKHARKPAEVSHFIPSHFMTPSAETLAAMREAAVGGEIFRDVGGDNANEAKARHFANRSRRRPVDFDTQEVTVL